MIKKVSISIFIIFLVGYSHSQLTLKGKVLDKENNAIEFVSIIVKKDSTIITNTYTDSLGFYLLNFSQKDNYTIIYTYSGYDRKIDTLTIEKDTTVNIYLNSTTSNIEEVIVTAKIPVVEKKIDKLIFNPSALISNVGNNAYDILKKAPTVTTDESGNVSIKGISGSGVMINGRLLQMSSEQIMDYLKAIPSDDIYKIEIISNPSSKYDAEGLSGLINIILKKSQKTGLTGTSNLAYEQTAYAKYNGNINLNYRSDKVNVFGGTSLRDGKYLLLENVDNIYNRNLNPYYYYEKGSRTRNELSNFNKIGIDVFLTKKSTLGIRLEHNYNSKNGLQSNNSSFQKNDSNIDSIYHSTIDINSINNSISTNLNYLIDLDTLGQSLSFDFDYLNYSQPELSSATSTTRLTGTNTYLAPDIVFKNIATQKINIHSIKADYSKPLNEKTWFDGGIKYYSLNTYNELKFYDNNFDTWNFNSTKSNNFNYNESNIAIYANINREITDKVSVQIGLRDENTFLKGSSSNGDANLSRSYNKLFPSVFLQYSKNDNNQISFTYSKRISRPDYSNLNPFKYFVSPNNYIVGDPFLQPAFTNSFDLSYLLKQNFYFSLFSNITTGQITQTPILESGTNSYKTISVNLDRSYSYGLNTYLSFNIKKWWQSSINLTAGLNGVKTIVSNSIYQSHNFNVFIFNNNQFKISDKRKVTAEINLMYQPKGFTQGMFTLGRMLDFSISFKKGFKDNKSALVFSVTDIFNSAYVTAKVNLQDQYSFIYGNYNRRGVKIAFSYKFGKKNIQQSREKKSSIEEEQKRLK